MPTLLISFRIDTDATYSDRWNSVMEAIRAQARDRYTYEEMTSLVIMNSMLSAEQAASWIYFHSKMNTTGDKLLVVDLDSKRYSVKGAVSQAARLQDIMSGGNNTLSTILGAIR